VVGSGDEYGLVEADELPVRETNELRPLSPYAVSKVAQDLLGYQFFKSHRLPVVRVRPFNHTGPGHDARFVIPSIARQLAQIEAGEREPVLRVGNLDVQRDFTDARDMVRAYRLAALLGEPGEVYNLGRGTALRIGEIVEALVAECRVPVRVQVDPALLRTVDLPRQQADIRKFTRLCGWQPRIPWQTTLQDTLQYWRQRVGSSNEEMVCVS
jgi:GDP-4-dehydro-6-deoxy-D-mannose reductase